MASELSFERPLEELEERIAELQRFAQEKNVDTSKELNALSAELRHQEQLIYEHLSPWQRVQVARHPDRPHTQYFIETLCDAFIPLHGDRFFGEDPAILGGIASFAGRAVTVIGHEKGRGTKENIAHNFGMASPEGYRKAIRLMRQAEKFHRPVLTFVDTPGAFAGAAAEERGEAWSIAESLKTMAGLRTPTVTVVTGEGGSGGALGLAVADRVFMLSNAVYSVISPEGAAALLWHDSGRAAKAAELLRITAHELLQMGLIDGVIEEPPGGAHRHPHETAEAVAACLKDAFLELDGVPQERRLTERYARFRRVGVWQEHLE